MTLSIMNLDIIQEFQVHPLARNLFQLTPKIKGYLHILHLLFFFLPSRLSLVKVRIRMMGKTVETVLDLRDMYQLDILVKNKNELVIPCILSSLIKEKSIVFDIGANCGWYSRVLGALNPEQVTILAFEPNRRAFFFLAKNATPNFFPIPFAVSNQPSKVLSGRVGFLRLSSGTEFRPQKDKSLYAFDDMEACSTTVDAVAKALHLQPTFLKIDVEGHELEVIQGAVASLPGVEAVVIEINEHHNQEDQRRRHEIFQLFQRYQFKCVYQISVQDKIIELIEEGSTPAGDILFSRKPVMFT